LFLYSTAHSLIFIMKTLLVTGSSGLIGSEVVESFSRDGWQVHGVDNNMRADFFGSGGDTRWNQQRHRPFTQMDDSNFRKII